MTMSSEREQARLDGFESSGSMGVSNNGLGPGVSAPNYRHDRAHCECGNWVGRDYVRVFGDNDGVLHNCPECLSQLAVMHGAGADPEYEHRVAPEGRR